MGRRRAAARTRWREIGARPDADVEWGEQPRVEVDRPDVHRPGRSSRSRLNGPSQPSAASARRTRSSRPSGGSTVTAADAEPVACGHSRSASNTDAQRSTPSSITPPTITRRASGSRSCRVTGRLATARSRASFGVAGTSAVRRAPPPSGSDTSGFKTRSATELGERIVDLLDGMTVPAPRPLDARGSGGPEERRLVRHAVTTACGGKPVSRSPRRSRWSDRHSSAMSVVGRTIASPVRRRAPPRPSGPRPRTGRQRMPARSADCGRRRATSDRWRA